MLRQSMAHMVRQQTNKQNKTTPKIPSSLFCGAHVLPSMGLSLSLVCISSETPLEKPDLLTGHHLEKASGLQIRGLCLFPLSVLEPHLS